MVTQGVWSMLSARGSALEGGFTRVTALTKQPPRFTPTPLPERAPDDIVQSYIPESVLISPQGLTHWGAELRTVTTVMTVIDGIDYEAPNPKEPVRQLIIAVTDTITDYGGVLHQFVVDDKGTVALAAFGLPGSTQEDNAACALRAALALPQKLKQIGMRGSIGVSTGRVFCGDRGSARRREYAIVGKTVVRAARLMLAPGGELLCDAITKNTVGPKARSRLGFELLPAIRLKGTDRKIDIYRPHLLSTYHIEETHSYGSLVGRETELDQLTGLLDAAALADGTGPTTAVVLRGEPGLGKSILLNAALRIAQDRGLSTMLGAADVSERGWPYHAWRAIFTRLFRMKAAPPSGEGRIEHVLTQLDAMVPGNRELAPLLNPVLDTELADTELTNQMQGAARANKTNSLLLDILASSRGANTTVIALEDAHWFDELSLALLRQVVSELSGRLVIVTTRPIIATPNLQRDLFWELDSLVWIDLEYLPVDQTAKLIADRIQADKVAEELVQFVHRRAEGNPFFTEEISYALSDAGHIALTNGYARPAVDEQTLSATVPPNVEGVVARRIDRLAANHQLSLKVASVIQRVFSTVLLKDIHPLEMTQQQLADSLRELEAALMIVESQRKPELTYMFKHAITQQVSYNMLLFSQRRELHRLIANWYELHHANHLAPFYNLLAHHYTEAHVVERAVDYLDKAGLQALNNDANKEALRRLQQAEELAAQLPATEDEPQHRYALASRYFGIAEASIRLGKIRASEKMLLRAFQALGRPIPGGSVGIGLKATGLLLNQTGRRLFTRGRVRQPLEGVQRDIEELCCRLYDRFTRIAFYDMNTTLTVYATLGFLATAERLGPSPELARAYANMCGASGLIPNHPIARLYQRKSAEIIAAVDAEDTLTHALALQVISVYTSGIGDFEQNERDLRKTADLFEKFGHFAEWGICMQMLVRSAIHNARFQDATHYSDEMERFAKRRGARVEETWAHNNRSELLTLTLPDPIEAEELATHALSLIPETGEMSSSAVVHAVLASARAARGNIVEAIHAAKDGLDILSTMQPTSYGMMTAYYQIADVLLDAREFYGNDAEQPTSLTADSAAAIKLFDGYASVFPIGKPRQLLLHGRRYWLEGKKRKSVARWREAITSAENLAMPYEGALAQLALAGAVNVLTEEERRQYRQNGTETLARLGTHGVRERLEARLEKLDQ